MMSSVLSSLGLLAAVAGTAGTLVGAASAVAGPTGFDGARPHARSAAAVRDTVSFASDILPIFQARCAECHGGEDEGGTVITEAYLNLLTYQGVMAGSEYGSVVEPGDPDASTLVDMISSGEMPEEGDPVPQEEIDRIRAWIEAGAPDN